MSTTSPNPAHGAFNAVMSASITVKDIQKSLHWYHEVVGFAVERTIDREGKMVMASLRSGDVRISLNQDDGAKGWDRIKGLGFSLSLWTDDDIDSIANRIKANAGTLDSETVDAPWGARFFRITDPDGFKLTVLKWLPQPK